MSNLYYPDIKSSQFLAKLEYQPVLKKYVYESYIDNIKKAFKLKSTGVIHSVQEFLKSPSQQFVSNYVSPNTPYRGLLLIHGVGAGKTCAGISIAEEFRQVFVRPILIIVPSSSLIETWKNEIFNFDKEFKKYQYNASSSDKVYNVQCTGDVYLPEESYQSLGAKKFRRIVNEKIKHNYQFKTYNTILNEYLKQKKSLNNKEKLNQWVSHEYSNRIIIMDEIHRVHPDVGGEFKHLEDKIDAVKVKRGKDASKMEEKWNFLKKITRLSKNSYLVCLTATPMYSDSNQIVDLVNLIREHSGFPAIQTQDFFSKHKNLSYHEFKDNDRIASKFKKKLTGFVSYVKGENPETFPLRLYPKTEWFKDKSLPNAAENHKCVFTLSKTLLSEWNKEDNETFQKLQLFYSPMVRNSNQHKYYCKIFNQTKKFHSFIVNSPLLQATILSVPELPKPDHLSNSESESESESDSDSEEEDNISLDLASQLKKYLSYCETSKKSEKLDFLKKDHLNQYSSKLFHLLTCIQDCIDGCVFVYSNFKEIGANIIALMLELNGYQQFHLPNSSPRSIFDKMGIPFMKKLVKHTKASPKYILLTGDTVNIDELVKEARGEGISKQSNLRGEHIKVVIGSKVLREGFSLFGIRQIHIIEPWYHLNSLEQSIGRGVRNYSHIKLPASERNVMIFLHCSTMPVIKNEKDFRDDVSSLRLEKIKTEEVPEEDDPEAYRENFERIIIQDKIDYHRRKNNFNKDSVISLMCTPDQHLYDLSIRRHKEIVKVTRLIEESAVDCPNNRNANIFSKKSAKKLNNLEMKLFNREEIKNVFGHEDNTLACQFAECEFLCDAEHDKNEKIKHYYDDIKWSGYHYQKHPKFNFIKNKIKHLFQKNWVLTNDEIVAALTKQPRDVTYGAIQDIVRHQEPVFDRYNRKGYLIYRRKDKGKKQTGFYIYQPIWDSVTEQAQRFSPENIPYSLRVETLPRRHKSIHLKIPKPMKKTVSKIPQQSLTEIVLCVSKSLDIFVQSNLKMGKYLPAKKANQIDFHEETGKLLLPSRDEYNLMLRFIFLDVIPITFRKELYRYIVNHISELTLKFNRLSYSSILSQEDFGSDTDISTEHPLWMLLMLYIFESPRPFVEQSRTHQDATSVSIVGSYDKKVVKQPELRLCGFENKKIVFLGNTDDKDVPTMVKLSFKKGEDIDIPFSLYNSYQPNSNLAATSYLEIKPMILENNFKIQCEDELQKTAIKNLSTKIKTNFKLKIKTYKSAGSVIYTKETRTLNEDYNKLIVQNYHNLEHRSNFFTNIRKSPDNKKGSKQDKIIWMLILSQYLRFSSRYTFYNSGKPVGSDTLNYYYLRPYERFISSHLSEEK